MDLLELKKIILKIGGKGVRVLGNKVTFTYFTEHKCSYNDETKIVSVNSTKRGVPINLLLLSNLNNELHPTKAIPHEDDETYYEFQVA